MYAEMFSKKLKKARENTGFTQREVCEELRLKQSTLASYEIGIYIPTKYIMLCLDNFVFKLFGLFHYVLVNHTIVVHFLHGLSDRLYDRSARNF